MSKLSMKKIKTALMMLAITAAISGCGKKFEPAPNPYSTPNPPPQGAALPVLTSVTPLKALPGSVITVKGYNFKTTAGTNTATINGLPVTVNVASSTQVLITVPADMPVGTTGRLVLNSGGTALTSVNDFTVTGGTVSQFTTFAPITITRFLIDPSGDLYGITPNSVLKTRLGGIRTSFASGSFAGLTDIATYQNETGQLYVADSSKRCIYRITPAGLSSVFAGSGVFGYNDGTGNGARFARPTGIAFDESGNLFVADEYRVRKVSSASVVTTLAGNAESGDSNGTGDLARFGRLEAIVTDLEGNVFVADNQYRKIRKITPAGITSTLAGSGSAGFNDDAGAAASFSSFGGMAIDAAGNIFVADRDVLTPIYKIRMINKLGAVRTLLTGFSNNSVINGPLANATVSRPEGLTFDAFGNLYIFNSGTQTINKVSFQ